MNSKKRPRLAVAVVVSAGLVVASAGCTSAGSGGVGQGGDPESAVVGIELPTTVSHVHGVGVDPETGDILVASHEGLYVLPAPEGPGEASVVPERIGPGIDLMGFSVAEPGRYVASGHPHEGVDMPNPVGLIESRDGGATWQTLSRAGESDFHALVANAERVVGFDGSLRATEDGSTWETLDDGIEPFSLSMADDGRTVVATTQSGLMRSTDGGAAFAPVEGAPPLALVDWVPETEVIFGVAVDGGVHRSEDAGQTWESTGLVEGEAQALHADAEQLVVVADYRVTRSTDAGATFRSW
ncbi:F510_1955 family glycosylhydrolase [Nocardiopsis sp. NPDC006139]|uniref:F510_1955 family glycosylhydrolase n=1 Tax=Nocardiopsis sp. NPDC006139 TaxID=3154578 RepID=UPI0033A9D88F